MMGGLAVHLRMWGNLRRTPYCGGSERVTPALRKDSLLAAPSKLPGPAPPAREGQCWCCLHRCRPPGSPRVGMVTRSVCRRCRPDRSVPARGIGYRIYADDDQARFTPVCGEGGVGANTAASLLPGLPPRAGKTADQLLGRRRDRRFTPARGEDSRGSARRRTTASVHPRARGRQACSLGCINGRGGSPPRVGTTEQMRHMPVNIHRPAPREGQASHAVLMTPSDGSPTCVGQGQNV